ncbi:hypothetical protein [Streptomyces sp. CAU 1734]|uniref:hypothetical protein n=1 Tax=Streptomyces sp. CAU 1734 TaxID=3140360 RepID=UPI003260AB39
MRRGLVHGVAWSMATGAAVTLTWWGVHTVMSGTAYNRPMALPINAPAADTPTSEPSVSATHRERSTTAEPGSKTVSGTGGGGGGGSTAPSGPTPRPPDAPPGKSPEAPEQPADGGSPSAPVTAESGEMKAYTVEGGRAVFNMQEKTATLASATPNAGWQMHVWNQEAQIRVTFTKDGREASVFCTWNGGTPTVMFYEEP